MLYYVKNIPRYVSITIKSLEKDGVRHTLKKCNYKLAAKLSNLYKTHINSSKSLINFVGNEKEIKAFKKDIKKLSNGASILGSSYYKYNLVTVEELEKNFSENGLPHSPSVYVSVDDDGYKASDWAASYNNGSIHIALIRAKDNIKLNKRIVKAEIEINLTDGTLSDFYVKSLDEAIKLIVFIAYNWLNDRCKYKLISWISPEINLRLIKKNLKKSQLKFIPTGAVVVIKASSDDFLAVMSGSFDQIWISNFINKYGWNQFINICIKRGKTIVERNI
jgi:hypothetical protein